MKRVDIISKVVGRDSSGKPVGGGISIPMGNYALKSDFELLKSMFNDFLEGDDTDSVINRWKDLEAFLNGISEEDPLTSILGNYIPISGYTEIVGEKNFVGGLKVNGSPIYYDDEKKYWKLEGDLLVTGGVTMYGTDSDFVPSTIMDAILYDNTTLGINAQGQLYVKGSVGGATTMGSLSNVGSWADSVASQDRIMYQAANSSQWVAKNLSDLAVGGVTGDYLPLSGGVVSGIITLDHYQTSNSYLSYKNNRMVSGSGNWAVNVIAFRNAESSVVARFGGYGTDATLSYLFLGLNAYNGDNLRIYGNKVTFGDSQLAYLTSNVASATKLQAARTIWGQNFDGTGNVSGTLSGVNDIDFASKGNYVVGTFDKNANTIYTNNIHSGKGNNLWLKSTADTYITNSDGTTKFLTIASTGNVGIGTTSPAYKLDVNGNIGCNNILPKTHNEYWLGDWGNCFAMANINIVYCGANNNNMWLVGGNSTDDTGVVIGRNSINSTSEAEICRFNANGMIWASGVSGDIRTRDTSIYIRRAGDSANTVMLGNGYFAPLSSSSDLLMLGRPASRWKGVYLGATTTTTINTNGVVFCDTSNYGQGVVSATSNGRIGIGACAEIYFRVGCTKGANGTITNSSTGAVLDTSSNLLVSGGITLYSDQRKKTILNHVELSLQQVANAPLIEHYYNSDQNKTTHVGSIAQYWAEMNDWFCKKDSEGFYTMEIQNAALASAISVARELVKFETETDMRIRLLEDENKRLKEEVERLKWNVA